MAIKYSNTMSSSLDMVYELLDNDYKSKLIKYFYWILLVSAWVLSFVSVLLIGYYLFCGISLCWFLYVKYKEESRNSKIQSRKFSTLYIVAESLYCGMFSILATPIFLNYYTKYYFNNKKLVIKKKIEEIKKKVKPDCRGVDYNFSKIK